MKVKTSKYVIVLTHDSVAPLYGGGGLRTLKIAQELNKRYYDVTLIAPLGATRNIDGLNIDSVKPPRKQHSQILSALKFNLRLLFKLIKHIKNTDLIIAHNTIAAATIPSLKRIFNFNFFLDITDIHAEYLLVGKRSMFEKILTPVLLKFEYYIINSADFIAVATKAMKGLLQSKGINGAKMAVVYDGIDGENIPQQKEKGFENNVIHLGAIDKQHGVDVLVHAIPYILQEIPYVKFYFVGGGRELPKIKSQAAALGISSACVFTGCLLQDEARNFLKNVSVGVIPRRDILPNGIVTTLKIFEYWASKTAVVSSKICGIEEIAQDGENILYFNSGDAKDLADKMIVLLKDNIFRERLILGGINIINQFQITVSASKIADFALSTLNRDR